MLSRRGLLGGILALGVAPVIIRTPGLIMPIKPVQLPVHLISAGEMMSLWGAYLNTDMDAVKWHHMKNALQFQRDWDEAVLSTFSSAPVQILGTA